MVTGQRPVFAIVLAAGKGERFGATKQIAEVDGEPMVRRACEVAREVCGDNCLLVTGHDAEAVLRATGDSVGFVVVNDGHADGIGSSIALAVRSLADLAAGVLVMLADQPRITAAHLRELLGRWDCSDHEIVATAFADTQGPPVLFPRGAFPELMALSGDRGARSLLHDAAYEVKTLAFADAAIDIDTPEQLDELRTTARPRPPVPGE